MKGTLGGDIDQAYEAFKEKELPELNVGDEELNELVDAALRKAWGAGVVWGEAGRPPLAQSAPRKAT